MKLKELRKETGYTQKEMAKMLNITQSAYSQYETGLIEPDIKTIINLANIFDISTDMLLERKYKKHFALFYDEFAEDFSE